MKAVHVHNAEGRKVFDVVDSPDPVPGTEDILIRVYASGVTPTELSWYPTWHTKNGDPRPSPVIPGHEFSGVIVEINTVTTDLRVGTEVYGMNDWFMDGAQAEFCIAKASGIAPKPITLNHVQAAAVPISALTAFQGLVHHANLKAGERVLIQGAAGGVGSFAVQLAHHLGSYVIGTCSSQNLNLVRELGADEIIDYKSVIFEEVVHEVDVVFDTVGGNTFKRSRKVLKKDGRMVTIASDSEGAIDPEIQEAFFIVEPNFNQLMDITRLIDSGHLKPVVDSIFSMNQARTAYGHKTLRGKAVLQFISE